MRCMLHVIKINRKKFLAKPAKNPQDFFSMLYALRSTLYALPHSLTPSTSSSTSNTSATVPAVTSRILKGLKWGMPLK